MKPFAPWSLTHIERYQRSREEHADDQDAAVLMSAGGEARAPD